VSEPAVEMPQNPGVTVKRGNATLPVTGKTLVDFTTLANLYQSCAALSTQVTGSPGAAFIIPAFAVNRCASLKTQGLLTAVTTPLQADEALQKLRDYGWEPESEVLHASLAAFEVASAVSVTFANSLSRASVTDNLCGYSFAATNASGVPSTLAPSALAQMFATGNGVPPSSGVQLINNNHPAGPLRDLVSNSPSSATLATRSFGSANARPTMVMSSFRSKRKPIWRKRRINRKEQEVRSRKLPALHYPI